MNYLVIATYNRADLLIPQIHKLIENNTIDALDKVLIYDNGSQKNSGLYDLDHIKVQVKNQGWNEGCGATWNKGLDESFSEGADSVIIYNDDCEWHPEPYKLKDFLDHYDSNTVYLSKEKGYTSFMVPKEVYKTIKDKDGFFFDPQYYPAYYEDNDIDIRLKLNKIKIEPVEILEPHVFRESQTIKKEPQVNRNFEDNKKKYIEKWGGLPHRELLSWETIKNHAHIKSDSSILIAGTPNSGISHAISVFSDNYNLEAITTLHMSSVEARNWTAGEATEGNLKGTVVGSRTLTPYIGEFAVSFDFIFFMWRSDEDINITAQEEDWEGYPPDAKKSGLPLWAYQKSYFGDHKPQNSFYLRYNSLPNT